jgi:hypothetical protein
MREVRFAPVSDLAANQTPGIGETILTCEHACDIDVQRLSACPQPPLPRRNRLSIDAATIENGVEYKGLNRPQYPTWLGEAGCGNDAHLTALDLRYFWVAGSSACNREGFS